MRTQLTRFRIDDRELLLDSQSEDVLFHQQRENTFADFADLHRLFLVGRARRIGSHRSGDPYQAKCEMVGPTQLRANHYVSSPNERCVTADCRNFPQLKLSRLGTCSRALRMAISEMASTTHSKFASPIHAASQSGAGLQKSMATGTPSRTANSTVFRS